MKEGKTPVQMLSEIQSELKAPKSQWNNFGKYNYRSCEDILEAVKPILAKYNAAITMEDEIIMLGTRYYVKSTAMLDFGGGEDSIFLSEAWAREAESKKGMDESQITGAASSYARKYALAGLLAIDDNKDFDTPEKFISKTEEASEKKNGIAYNIEDVPRKQENPTPAQGIKGAEKVDPGPDQRAKQTKVGDTLSLFQESLPDSEVKEFVDDITQHGRYYAPPLSPFNEEANRRILACEGRGKQDAKSLDGFILTLQSQSKAKGKGKTLDELKATIMEKKTFDALWSQYCEWLAKTR